MQKKEKTLVNIPKDNPLKIKLSRNEPILGIWSIIPSPALIEVFAYAGFDFVILDMEHGPYGFDSLEGCIRACEISDCSAIVRPPGADLFSIQKALDLGSRGIVIPQVSNYETAKNAAQTTKYAPEGNRGYNPFTRAAEYLPPAKIPFGKLDNSYGMTGVIIETIGAYEDLQQILELSIIDWVYLGAYDMSIALGCSGNTKHPLVLDFIEKAVKMTRDAGKMVGMMVRSEEEISKALAIGVNILVYSVDTSLIYHATDDIVKLVNQLKKG